MPTCSGTTLASRAHKSLGCGCCLWALYGRFQKERDLPASDVQVLQAGQLAGLWRKCQWVMSSCACMLG